MPAAPQPWSRAFKLEFPQSLATYDDYPAAQRTVDFLSDEHFPVENCMIVGTDLKQVERITGRLSYGRVAMAGALSGLWLGVFVGVIFALFDSENQFARIVTTAILGAMFGIIWAVAGFAATRGQRDFASVSAVVATKYEVLVEHKHLAQAQQLLAKLPGALPNPFA
ncbi:MAG: hypothetical protein J7518_11590 [Nocardioidaceae bacterium]|nr:hypothetical protein [Nocardioidaceae bacterium]